MKLSDALDLFDNEEVTSDVQNNLCLITHEPIKNEITLKCSHKFEYEAIFNNLKITQRTYNYHSCPYCRSTFKNFIPYYEECIERDDTFRNLFKKNDYLKCTHKFISGKRKGQCCGRDAHKFKTGIYCTTHSRPKPKIGTTKPVTKCQCSKILKNGNRCRNKVFNIDMDLCKLHYNKSQESDI